MKNVKRVLSLGLVLIVLVTSLTACSFLSQMQLRGAWRDSTGTTGYDFQSDNKCVITYADVTIPIINIRYDGSVDGIYTIEKKDDGNMYVEITYTILSKSITQEYMFKVDGSTLTLTDPESGESTILMEYTAPETTAPSSSENA